jgi:hypothetical protein
MTTRRMRLAQRGLAYLEVMVALVLVMTALVPALNALSSSLLGSQALADAATRDTQLRNRMDEVMGKPYSLLLAQTNLSGGNTTTSVSVALSDAVGPNRRIVILYRTDGSAVSATDTGLLRVRVAWEAGGTGLESLRSKWF